MDAEPYWRKDWGLNKEAFDKLLASLNADREAAAVKYESIRRKLVTFFECRGCCSPEEYADVTINRVARKISEGKEIYTSDPWAFFFGVARRVLQEYWADKSKTFISFDPLQPVRELSEDPHEVEKQEAARLLLEQQIKCLEKCLEELPSGSRELIIQYYYGETKIKIKNRRRLAEELGIQMNALRIRALRIREKLESCLNTCLEQSPTA